MHASIEDLHLHRRFSVVLLTSHLINTADNVAHTDGPIRAELRILARPTPTTLAATVIYQTADSSWTQDFTARDLGDALLPKPSPKTAPGYSRLRETYVTHDQLPAETLTAGWAECRAGYFQLVIVNVADESFCVATWPARRFVTVLPENFPVPVTPAAIQIPCFAGWSIVLFVSVTLTRVLSM